MTPTITAIFSVRIKQHEIPAFRGTILSLLRPDVPLVFHNHMPEGVSFKYPLVQYKVVNGYGAIVLIGDATIFAVSVLSLAGNAISISGRTQTLNIARFIPEENECSHSSSDQSYSLVRWCPLNSNNYGTYLQLDGVEEKRGFLEKILTGNILSMFKGLGIFVSDTIKCHITSIKKEESTSYKGVDYITMDIDFSSNYRLPNMAGLGKHASVGFGTIWQMP